MYAPVHREYIFFHDNLSVIYFINGWAYFCQMNDIVGGSMFVVRVEMREQCIGLFVSKLR
jgi:hypothetical protein